MIFNILFKLKETMIHSKNELTLQSVKKQEDHSEVTVSDQIP